MKLIGKLPCLMLAFLPLACGATAPTQQLVDARRSYELAARSPASTLTPAQLLEAEVALNRAEQAHKSDPGSESERHLAYLAQRRSEIAMVESELVRSRTELGSMKKSQEAVTEQGLKNAQNQVEARDGQIQDLRAKEQQLNSSKAALKGELAGEREARLKAEATAAAALASLKEVAMIKEEATSMTITLSGSVLFATGQKVLLPIAKSSLDKVAEALKLQRQDRPIVVLGHTDSMGSDEANQALSLARAEAVREYLVSQGIESQRISAAGKGESTPVADNKSAEGRANNRRVEIVVSGAPTPALANGSR
ncbi:MAG: OmpA family protein [Polyangiaceae bacterium]|nr:OmpA family protein [Polyangiaceae bacterium]